MTHLALLSNRINRLLFSLPGLLLLAACAGPGSHSLGPSAAPASTIAVDPAQRGDVVLTAMGLMETRYRYGGSKPATGFDCSGLVAYVFKHAASQVLPHNTAAIARLSRPISKAQLQAGDLVFFNTLNRSFSHMGIYLGGGRFINAPSSGGRVRIDSLSNPYYDKHYESAGTLFSS
ncbi:C40 family peptidase [Pollutimonas harenae]|uniref:C40 family peptidase n=1 Tax=Pollutimonas harenae TaxID=657015 RepID=A0A853GXC2_9BURK|nr:C40 family peptidase [Pollutimonas harenae]NYT86797.1 C40 family peptidase [Pollutimonas harenae]TEA71443.1 peptidoglycan endopeptidase [Pollutimonas harenae]